MNGIQTPSEVSKIKAYLNDKLNVTSLDDTIKINREIIADLTYANKSSKQAILSSLNNLDNYLYNTPKDDKKSAKITMLSHQVGTAFASSLSIM